MLSKPILTCVILTFNHKDNIAKCIKSIVNQKTSYPYVIHIWDDCSTDGTSEICQKYAQKYPDKIKLFLQPENTFCKPYEETQSFKSMQNIDTKYFSIIEGDDNWCDENKIQTAIEFLESHPEYSGWASDTKQIESNSGIEHSWVHDVGKLKIKNPITFGNPKLFLMTSARFFRNLGYKDLKILPVDYMVWNYHLEKGPVFYYDKITSEYAYGGNPASFTSLESRRVQDLTGMFSYKLSVLFNFKHDAYCMQMLKNHDIECYSSLKYYNLLKCLKKIFGIKMGWNIWFFFRFVPYYGFESMSLSYVYPRKLIKERSDKANSSGKETLLDSLKALKNKSKFLKNKKYVKNITDEISKCYEYGAFRKIIQYRTKYTGFSEQEFSCLRKVLLSTTQKVKKYRRKRKKYQILALLFFITTCVLFYILLRGN